MFACLCGCVPGLPYIHGVCHTVVIVSAVHYGCASVCVLASSCTYVMRCAALKRPKEAETVPRATGLLSAAPLWSVPSGAECLHECGRLCLCVHELSAYCAQNRDGFACHIYTTLKGLYKECLPKGTGPGI